jgi:hypothetical protein
MRNRTGRPGLVGLIQGNVRPRYLNKEDQNWEEQDRETWTGVTGQENNDTRKTWASRQGCQEQDRADRC